MFPDFVVHSSSFPRDLRDNKNLKTKMKGMFSTFWNFWNLVLYYPPASGAMFGFLHFPTEVSSKQSVSNAPKGVPSMRRWESHGGPWKNPIPRGSCTETLPRSWVNYDSHEKGFHQISRCSICNDVCGVIAVSQLWHAMVMWCHCCGYSWSQEPWCLSRQASAHLSHASRQENLATRDLTDTQGETLDSEFQGSWVIDLLISSNF